MRTKEYDTRSAALPTDWPRDDMISAARLHALFSGLEYLDAIPLAVIQRWSPKDRAAAERWAEAWDRCISDVSDHPLPNPPEILWRYLPQDVRVR